LNIVLRILLVCYLFLSQKGRAQDIHFSQFDGALLNISPGYTGLFNGTYRVSAIYRTQWQAVPVGYNTFNINGETVFKPYFLKHDKIGAGLSFYNDRAGDARYGTTQIYAQGNYLHVPRFDTCFLFTFGLNIGWNRVGFDLSKMTFDTQYQNGQVIPGAYSGEQFTRTKDGYFDMNLGSVIEYKFSQTKKLSFGVGLHHITKPVISYQGNDLSKLDFKYSNLIGYYSRIGNSTHLITEALVSVQGKNYELIPHVGLKYVLNEDDARAISGGLCLRARDALVVRLGYHYKGLNSGMSYDINLSPFIAATNRRGGFEIFVNQVISPKTSTSTRRRTCPVFL
jgi:type IX secretion system PorP/SprF family membrane protein